MVSQHQFCLHAGVEIVDYRHLDALLTTHRLRHWGRRLPAIIRRYLQHHPHGKTSEWRALLSRLPQLDVRRLTLDADAVTVDGAQSFERDALAAELMRLSPWRKGPFWIHGVEVDSEWRANLKWRRLSPHISPLAGRRVLDIGCGNGYYLWRMLGAGARCAIGVDPIRLFAVQFQALRHFFGVDLPLTLLPIGIENLPSEQAAFDSVFSMGVLYHRSDPINHIHRLRALLRRGGELVLETLIIEDDAALSLKPKERYAGMANVHHIPSPPQLIAWLHAAGFDDINVADVTPTSGDEQRATAWMRGHSLQNFLAAGDPTKTIEGYPAPTRAIVIAQASR